MQSLTPLIHIHNSLKLSLLKFLKKNPLQKVISGGQTGADYAGLIAASYAGIATGGTAPKGWRIKLADGSESTDPTLANFGLIEHESSDYDPRTIENVLASHGTVWFGYSESPGGQLTIKTAIDSKTPYIINPNATELAIWIYRHNIKVLNVSGNAKSQFNPSIYEDTLKILHESFRLLN